MLIKRIIRRIFRRYRHASYGYLDTTAELNRDSKIYAPNNLYMYEHTNIDDGAVIMNTRARFVMKRYSGAAFGLTVVTGDHFSIPGMMFKQITNEIKDKYDTDHLEDQDIVVDEDVWIASHVTLLKGAHIGRGAVIGSGACIRSAVPPYSIVVGNPAKVIGFKFVPEEILKHECALYPPEERLPKALLERNYEKYFLSRVQEIKSFLKI